LNRIVGLLIVIVSLAYTIGALKWSLWTEGNPGPGLFPVIIGIIALIAGVMCIVEGVIPVNGKQTLIQGLKWSAFLVALTVLVVFLMEFLGIAIGSGLAFAAVLTAGGYRRKFLLILIPIITTVSIYLVFGWWLHLPYVWIQ